MHSGFQIYIPVIILFLKNYFKMDNLIIKAEKNSLINNSIQAWPIFDKNL